MPPPLIYFLTPGLFLTAGKNFFKAAIFFFRYYFPTYENDNLLCQLEDEEDFDSCHGNENVIAEDAPVIDTILSEENLRKEILTT